MTGKWCEPIRIILFFLMLSVLASETFASGYVYEQEKQIPLVYDVDVLVIGGTSGGVAAAAEAARSGAKVFLAAPRNYLGEDICSFYRYWLEGKRDLDTPLAKKIFSDTTERFLPLPFTYKASMKTSKLHQDEKQEKLSDGVWGNARHESVQYDGDVSIIVDLGKSLDYAKIDICAFQSKAGDYSVDSVSVSKSNDLKAWTEISQIVNQNFKRGVYTNKPLEMSRDVRGKSRYIKLDFKKGPKASRILLGEIKVMKSESSSFYPPTPLKVKSALDQELLDSGVEFLYGCYPTDVLYNTAGNVSGVVIANKSGRQAIKAKVVIDATHRGVVARMAGAEFTSYPKGIHHFKRIVIGGDVASSKNTTARKIPIPILNDGKEYYAIEYDLGIYMPDDSFASFAKAEQIARNRTWHKNQVDASEVIFEIPPDSVVSKGGGGQKTKGVESIDIAKLEPAGTTGVYVLGPCADISREAAGELLCPLNCIKLGVRLGKHSAEISKGIQASSNVFLPGNIKNSNLKKGKVCELLKGLRSTDNTKLFVKSEERALPIIGQYDVVVVGGGTSGAPAAIGAAREGAKTLVIEYQNGLGGVGTLGRINTYWYGYIAGFTKEVENAETRSVIPTKRYWDIQHKMEWFRNELVRADADVWFGTLGCGALVDDGKVNGVVVATPLGRGIVLSKVVIDATGNSDVAISAGANYMFVDGEYIAPNGTGLPPVKVISTDYKLGYTNTDYDFVDESDMIDVWRMFVLGKKRFSEAYDIGQLLDTRGRRRIVGDYILNPIDIFAKRDFPDTVCLTKTDYDLHSYTVSRLLSFIKPPKRVMFSAKVPYRCLLPKTLEQILVVGVGISAHRDCMPVLRMQGDLQNLGYAAGLSAAMSVADNTSPRDIDVKKLQKKLVVCGNLPASMVDAKDSFPLTDRELEASVAKLLDGYDLESSAKIFASSGKAIKYMKKAYRNDLPYGKKLRLAHILAMLGDNAGIDVLVNEISIKNWDEKSWRSLVSLVFAAGYTRDSRAVDAILQKANELDVKLADDEEILKYRAVAVALEEIGSSKAAKGLADILKKKGISGYTVSDLDGGSRIESLREIMLARALYRCGDYEDLGESTLMEYAKDLRGYYSRHAKCVLEEKAKSRIHK